MPIREDAILLAAWEAVQFERDGLQGGEPVVNKVRLANGDWRLRLVGGVRVFIRVRSDSPEEEEVEDIEEPEDQ